LHSCFVIHSSFVIRASSFVCPLLLCPSCRKQPPARTRSMPFAASPRFRSSNRPNDLAILTMDLRPTKMFPCSYSCSPPLEVSAIPRLKRQLPLQKSPQKVLRLIVSKICYRHRFQNGGIEPERRIITSAHAIATMPPKINSETKPKCCCPHLVRAANCEARKTNTDITAAPSAKIVPLAEDLGPRE
jgi:hypothetical protein